MKDKAKVDFSADRIFSTAETGQPKSEVLKQLEQKHPGTSYHFVEDKLGTLDKVQNFIHCLSYNACDSGSESPARCCTGGINCLQSDFSTAICGVCIVCSMFSTKLLTETLAF